MIDSFIHVFLISPWKHMLWVLIRSANEALLRRIQHVVEKKEEKSVYGAVFRRWIAQEWTQPEFFSAPFWKVYSKRKEFAPHGSKFFPFRVDLLKERIWWTEKQINQIMQKCRLIFALSYLHMPSAFLLVGVQILMKCVRTYFFYQYHQAIQGC